MSCYTRGREGHEKIKKSNVSAFSFCKDLLFLLLKGKVYDAISIHVLVVIIHWNNFFHLCFLPNHNFFFRSLGKILITKCGQVFMRAAVLWGPSCWWTLVCFLGLRGVAVRQIVVNLPGLLVCWEYTESHVSDKIHSYRSALVSICGTK